MLFGFIHEVGLEKMAEQVKCLLYIGSTSRNHFFGFLHKNINVLMCVMHCVYVFMAIPLLDSFFFTYCCGIIILFLYLCSRWCYWHYWNPFWSLVCWLICSWIAISLDICIVFDVFCSFADKILSKIGEGKSQVFWLFEKLLLMTDAAHHFNFFFCCPLNPLNYRHLWPCSRVLGSWNTRICCNQGSEKHTKVSWCCYGGNWCP